ncbi:hypothetical protein NKDENANG_01911 [Candidatus Entotheonellaceae bacterium PAL068K]
MAYRGERELTIGLDFGTSCTKVVLRDPALRTADAVPFEGLAYPQNPYLLPTKIYIDREGCVSLQPPTAEGQVDADLKLDLMRADSSDVAPSANAAVYLGLVLREVKRWFAEAKGPIYQNMKLIWWLNIGLPSRSYDNPDLCQVFRTVALAAWQLACYSGAITQERACQAVLQARQRINAQLPVEEDDIHPDRVCELPEIIAEVAGYARSPRRREGMYLIVDVGASTLDISTFILWQSEGEDTYAILTAEVEELGVLKLHQWRLDEVARLSKEWRDKLSGAGDGVTPIPELKDYIFNPQQVELAEVDKIFQKNCAVLIRLVVHATKHRRNPLAPAWERGLPVFISGGGAQMPLYREVLELAEERLNIMWAGFQEMEPEQPGDLEAPGLEDRDYHRLAVAYGLSFSSLDIGEITPPGAIPDISRDLVVLDVSRRYVSKDMV